MKVRRIHHHVRLALKKRQKQILLDFVNHSKNNDEGLLEDETRRESNVPTNSKSKPDDDDDNDFVYIDLQRPKYASASLDAGVEFRVPESYRSSDLSSRDAEIVESGDEDDSELDNEEEEEEEKLYLNQYDMALVQSAFVAGVVLYPDWIGINDRTEAFEDYIYTWRVFGWFLGELLPRAWMLALLSGWMVGFILF